MRSLIAVLALGCSLTPSEEAERVNDRLDELEAALQGEGLTGQPGLTGPTGPDGADGPTGPQGDVGQPGECMCDTIALTDAVVAQIEADGTYVPRVDYDAMVEDFEARLAALESALGPDLSAYATLDDLAAYETVANHDADLAGVTDMDLSDYALLTDLTDYVTLPQHLSDLADKADLAALDVYETVVDHDADLAGLPKVDTSEFVTLTLYESDLAGKADLSALDVYETIVDHDADLAGLPEADLSGYALLSDLDDFVTLDDLAAYETVVDHESDIDALVFGISDVGITMVPIAAGTFEMGCTPEQAADGNCDTNELDVHTVTLTHDFLLAETEVTQSQYEAVMGETPSFFAGCDACPAEQVSWDDAALFTNALSSIEGLDACYTCTGGVCTPVADVYGCEGYRLPTEAEWEYAARCGEGLVYAGSNDVTAVAWYVDNSGGVTHPAAGLAPNGCGFYDMSGNVWEWTNDWYESDYGIEAEADPLGAPAGVVRVVRGGDWDGFSRNTRTTSRNAGTPSGVSGDLGFRPVRSVLND